MASVSDESLPATATAAIHNMAENIQEKCHDADEKKASDPSSDNDRTESANHKGEKIMVGMVCEKKDLYQKIDKHNKATWTDVVPDDLDEAAENEETEKYAFLIRNSKSTSSLQATGPPLRHATLIPVRKELRLAQEAGD
jgi:hypothetical protein